MGYTASYQCKSLLNSFFCYSRHAVTEGYDVINSLSRDNAKKVESLRGIGKVNIVKFTPSGTGVEMTREIVSIEDINNIDLEDWILKFQNTAKLCKWTDSSAIRVLKAIVPSNLVSIIKTKYNLEGCFKLILKKSKKLSRTVNETAFNY